PNQTFLSPCQCRRLHLKCWWLECNSCSPSRHTAGAVSRQLLACSRLPRRTVPKAVSRHCSCRPGPPLLEWCTSSTRFFHSKHPLRPCFHGTCNTGTSDRRPATLPARKRVCKAGRHTERAPQ